MPVPLLSKRTEAILVVLVLVAVIGLQLARPIPLLVLGVALASGLIGGFIPQIEGWNGLRVLVHIVPICFAVAVRLSAASLGVQLLALGQCFLLVLCCSGAVDVLYWHRRQASRAG
jgi:hypothetical protein